MAKRNNTNPKPPVNPEPPVEEVIETSVEIALRVVNCNLLNVRKEPSINADVLEVIKAGDLVTPVDVVDDFYKVVTTSGCEGYVMKNYVE